MAVQLNHTIVHARDALTSASFMAEILGLNPPRRFYHFWIVETSNQVTLDFLSTDEPIQIAHYAFLVSEPEFDAIFGASARAVCPTGPIRWAASRGDQSKRWRPGRLLFRDPSGTTWRSSRAPTAARRLEALASPASPRSAQAGVLRLAHDRREELAGVHRLRACDG